MAFRDRLLGTRIGYTTFRRLIRADRGVRMMVDTYIRPQAGQTIADLGCGTGDLANFLPADVDYLGLDHNAAYLAPTASSAHRRFLNADLANLAEVGLPPIDTAFALGVLHHLPDQVVRDVLASVADVLRPGGRLITIDPVFVPDQPSVARVLMAMDRGRFVRQREHYEALVREQFPHATTSTRSDINPFPYTHFIVEATQAVA